jgi:DNA-binding MarR family transcriptional regulator/GNAT superfamily N-acetyltransferase
MATTSPVDAIRAFNRFYTQKIGVLQEKHLHSDFSLTQGRILYELAHRTHLTAAEISRDLGLDAGYVSRTLGAFRKTGMVQQQQSDSDGRRNLLSLTAKGRKAFDGLNTRARDDIEAMLASVAPAQHARLTSSMQTIREILSPESRSKPPYLLRTHQPGDIGWVIHRHGALYAEEYGWDTSFEALVGRIAVDFLRSFDPKRERCWIAEIDGRNVGSIFLVKKSATVAKLRLLLVEPEARGLGIGARLVSECIRFARQAGYRKITLWTQSSLHSARKIYQGAGFELIHEEPHNNFGHQLTAQTWELKL